MPDNPKPPIPVPTTLTGRGLEEWNRVAPLLEKNNRLNDLTLTAFTLYCQLLTMLDTVLADATRTDNPKVRADLLRRADALVGRVREGWKEFGLSPRGMKLLGDDISGESDIIEFL